MTARNAVIAPAGVFPGAGVTYVASDGTLKAARVLALGETQTATVNNSRDDNRAVAPASNGNVHIEVTALTGKVYHRYDVPVVSAFAAEATETDDDDDTDW